MIVIPGGWGSGGGGGGGVEAVIVLLEISGEGVPHGSPNPDQKMPFSTPVFRPYSFSDLAFRKKLCRD